MATCAVGWRGARGSRTPAHTGSRPPVRPCVGGAARSLRPQCPCTTVRTPRASATPTAPPWALALPTAFEGPLARGDARSASSASRAALGRVRTPPLALQLAAAAHEAGPPLTQSGSPCGGALGTSHSSVCASKVAYIRVLSDVGRAGALPAAGLVAGADDIPVRRAERGVRPLDGAEGMRMVFFFGPDC
jgi:hypothetical protein